MKCSLFLVFFALLSIKVTSAKSITLKNKISGRMSFDQYDLNYKLKRNNEITLELTLYSGEEMFEDSININYTLKFKDESFYIEGNNIKFNETVCATFNERRFLRPKVTSTDLCKFSVKTSGKDYMEIKRPDPEMSDYKGNVNTLVELTITE